MPLSMVAYVRWDVGTNGARWVFMYRVVDWMKTKDEQRVLGQDQRMMIKQMRMNRASALQNLHLCR